MSDIRIKAFINIAGIHLGLLLDKQSIDENVDGVELLEKFLDVDDFLLISAALDNKERIKFNDKVISSKQRIVLFYKTRTTKIKEENMLSFVIITSIEGPPVPALYHTLNNVYAPLISNDVNKKNINDFKLEENLANLQAGLKSAILTGDLDAERFTNLDVNSCSEICSIQDEVEYWQSISKQTVHSKNSTVAISYIDILIPLARDFSILDASPASTVETILDSAHATLDDLWRHDQPYPQIRIKHMFDIIAYAISNYISGQLRDCDIWANNQTSVDLLQQSIGLGTKWLLSCKELTHIFWPNYSLHQWKGPVYTADYLQSVIDRLQEILSIKTLHKQLTKLLNVNEQHDLKTDDIFTPFKDLSVLDYGNRMQQSLNIARKQFEYLLQPAEQMVAIKLKKQLASIEANPRQLLHEFGRYSELVCRPIVKNTLKHERIYLLSILQDSVKFLVTQINEETILSSKYDTPRVVAEIITTRHLEAKALEIKNVSHKILEGLEGYDELEKSVNELIKDLKLQINELYNSWCSEINTEINDKSLSLKENEPVVKFAARLMKVNYSTRLVSLISEVRQLIVLGFSIPVTIEDASAHAKEFLKYAKYLDQITNFHNTIGDKMIPSQRPMMLSTALELSRLVQEQEVVPWGDIKSVDKYVQSLKVAVDKLSHENNLLAAYNVVIMEKLNKLSDVDLIKYYIKWKTTAKEIREILTQVQQKGFKNMQTWKLDLDKYLCNILEHQYIQSLDSVHLFLPDIQAELIYRNSLLLFMPSEQELKEKYENQLKRFLDIPKRFRGFSDNIETNIYPDIINRNSDKLLKVKANTDNLFVQLQGVKRHWESWLSLGSLDTSQLIISQHWDLHFRASKTFGQEIAKLPSIEERMGCFIIGLSRLRSDLESHNRSYWDQLISSLKLSIQQNVDTLQNYVDSSTAVLNRQPLVLEQIEENNEFHSDILAERPEMEVKYRQMHEKVNVLATWTRERVDAINRLESGWDRLHNLLENHQHIMAKQIENIKSTIHINYENLKNDVDLFMTKWDNTKLSNKIESTQLSDQLKNMNEIEVIWNELKIHKDNLLNKYNKFNIEAPDFTMYEIIDKSITDEMAVWENFDKFSKELEKINNEEWITFRKKIYTFSDFLSEWKLTFVTINNELSGRLLQEIDKYQACIPVLINLKGDDFTESHWIEVLVNLLGLEIRSLEAIFVKDFLGSPDTLINQQSNIQAICKRATSEIVVRQALSELDQWDLHTNFQLINHENSGIQLIKEFNEILNKVGDNQSLLQSVKNSSHYETFSERVILWETRLYDLDRHITSLAQIQRKWLYLQPIFDSGTLAQEKSRFEKLDRDFRNILKYIENESRVCALCRYPNIASILDNLVDQLSRCQKSLDEFLTDKRNSFPRFLFLNDDDLLEVVGQSSKEHIIQSHLKKIFAGINSIIVDNSGKKIIEMCSSDGEIVTLSEPVNIDQQMEDWLNNLVSQMQTTLKDLLVQCLSDGKSPDPLKYPSQVLCLADSITFTTKCEQAITNMNLPQALSFYKNQMSYYSSIDLNEVGSKLMELKLKALLLDNIHHIEVLEELIEENVSNISDWKWQKQLRFYSNSSGHVTIKMVNARIEYAYEYIGNAPKLVRTRLTDQCFLTLTQGMHLGLGGNPYGPAGTGKTESVKALGHLLGRHILVFNCDEGIDAASMGRILSGLVQCGAWGCFDEFNRLDEATLSAVSMYIQPIQNALLKQKPTVTIMSQEIKVYKHCGIFVTLNPAGGAYGGRNKLPDNLKQLFRPIVMSQPDHIHIVKTLLHCDGYKHGDVIGRKIIELFSQASKLLSKQQHYDWGLRAIRTVLNGCGDAIKDMRKNDKDTNITLQIEENLVTGALILDTSSKLTFADRAIFEILLKDVFNEVEFKKDGHSTLTQALHSSFEEMGLVKNDRQVAKCIELYEQMKQRMGVAIVGPSSCGKSVTRNLLYNALIKMGLSIKQHILNPKSIPRHQLLGQINVDTRQWIDGVLTKYSLKVTEEPPEVTSWIVCDGDIDPEWVESLNSVMDDNRLLCMPSGWRIQFGQNVNFLFESNNLMYASPATISRMGIVFLSDEDINLRDYVTNFQLKYLNESNSTLESYINDYLYKAVNWVLNEAEIVIKRSKISVIRTVLSQLVESANKQQFIVGMLNGLGGQLTDASKLIFAQQIFDWAGLSPPANILESRYNKNKGIIDSYHIDSPKIIDSSSYEMPLVLVADVVHTIEVLLTWLKANDEQHFLIVGPHGSAKTLILEYLVRDRSDCEISTIHCNANISTTYVIQKILKSCIAMSSNKGRLYKPKKGHLVLYFKNMHLLKSDQWGTNMVISFLQQLITYKGFFDHCAEWVRIENITVVGSLTDTNMLSSRFTSLVHVYNISLPNSGNMQIIFMAYLTMILKNVVANNVNWGKDKLSKLISTMLLTYNEIKETFAQEVNCQHYVFSPHDLTRWCKGFIRYKLQNNDAEVFLLEAMCHEALRIFYDKLVTSDERDKLIGILSRKIEKDWSRENIARNVSEVFYVASSQFNTNKKYIPLTKLNVEDWSTIVKKGIIQYERDGTQLHVQIIPELLTLSANISKILTTSGGHCLLIGLSGVGRRSAVKIISALESAKVITPVSHTEPHFKNDIKMAMQFSGVDNVPVYLIIEDHVLKKDSVLNLISTFISSGEIPELFNSAEIESITSGLKEEASRDNFDGNVLDFFTERVKNKLHIIVCIEKDNINLWEILENCSALIQTCSVIWLDSWNQNSTEIMPELLIKKVNDKKQDNNYCTIGTNYFASVHDIVAKKLATPYRYVKLIETYIEIYTTRKTSILEEQTKLKAGVSKLTESRNIVADLKLKALEQHEKLADKQIKANSALDMISNTMQSANVQKEEMEALKKQTETENLQLIKRKKEIEEELSQVEPLIQEARSAVGNLKTESLSEIRSLRAPPEIIRDILEGVLRLMGTQDTSWNSMKTFLAKRGIKEDIKAFDAGRIIPENRQAVELLVQQKSDSFDPKSAKRASVAAAPLAAWVLANIRYSKVTEKIKPLEKEQNRLQQNLTTAETHLKELSAGLIDVNTSVSDLKHKLSTYTREAAEIEINLNVAQETLTTAEGLVGQLIDEFDRWQSQLIVLEEDLKNLPNNCLLAAAFIIYLSSEPEDIRLNTMKKIEFAVTNANIGFVFHEFMSSEREQLLWQNDGLSADKLSVQNAIIIFNTKICPLLIDPTSVGINWIKNHFKTNNNLECITQNSAKFYSTLELSIRFGKTLLVEEVESVTDVLYTVLRRQFICQGERVFINIHGKLIDCHADFMLLLSSRNAQLQLPSDALAVLNIINFTTTHAGLCELLLISAIRQESPELEERRRHLLRKSEELQLKQHTLQTQLLEDLANSSGNILQNKNLISSLNETKSSSNAITNALTEASSLQEKLYQEYAVFNEISTFGSSLYFAAAEMSRINILYSLSVSSYIHLYLQALPPNQELQNTENYFHKKLIQNLYQYMGRGVFKTDRLLFLLHLTKKMFPTYFDEKEWMFFLGLSNINIIKNDNFNKVTWLSEPSLSLAASLEHCLPILYNSLKLNEHILWKPFMEMKNCESKFPDHCKLNDFQKVLLVQVLRGDRLYSAITQFVLQLTGLKSLNLDILQFTQIYNDSTCTEPILIITTSGNDPSVEVRELASNIIGSNNYIEISMGEGIETKAVTALEDAAQFGRWLIIKNLHLVTSWLPLLCQHLQNLKIHKHFRLWLVTEYHALFSSVLAEMSLKIAYESPQGIKSNLHKIYTSYGKTFIEKLTPTASRIFFVLACIHAVLLGRRKYIPQGWSKWYEFSDIDFNTLVKLCEELWNTQNATVKWKYVRGWSSQAIYGGRIDNTQDFAILESYLNKYCKDDVLSLRWKPFGLSNTLPSTSNYEEYINAVVQLSSTDLPSYFGLPENIERTWEKNCSMEVIQHLKNLEVSENISQKVDRQMWLKRLSPFMSQWKKLQKGFDFLHLDIATETITGECLSHFISAEFQRAVALIQNIHKTFQLINKAIKGKVFIYEHTFKIANELQNLKTPTDWLKLYDGPKDPSKYLCDIMNKAVKISMWKNEKQSFFKSPLNISHLFNPDSFLASYKQYFCRESKIPMDELILISAWKEIRNSIVLEGLLIEGAVFDGLNLMDCTANSDNINPLPHCYITWHKHKDVADTQMYIQVPLYYTSSREKQLTTLLIPCDIKEKDKWMQTGLSIFLDY